MSKLEEIRWLKIMKEAESKEGFKTLFDEDEECDVQELLTAVIDEISEAIE